MFKKKQKQTEKLPPKQSPLQRVDTQSDYLPHKQPQTRVSFGQRCEYSEVTTSRLKLKCKQLEKAFQNVQNILEEELDLLLIGEPIWKTYLQINKSQLFRVKNKNKQEILDDLGKIIQACQLLCSKLRNNQKVKDVLYVKDEQDLLLFFKHLFGKPYTVCNLPNFRKVLNTIWQHQIFQTFDPVKMADHLRLWSIGIQFPLNPAAIPLHRLVFTNPSLIKKHALLLCNTVTYCHIDSGDCMGLTPLLVAAHANKSNAYEHIIKSGANLFACPVKIVKNSYVGNVTKKGNKQTVEAVYPVCERRQFNVFQVLTGHRQFQQLVNILTLNEVYKLKKMKKSNAEIQKMLLQIPDCCLQVHWKTFKGFLSFKQLPKDVITVYKKKGSLRIDYHVDDLEQMNNKQGHFSILIRTGKQQGSQKLQYYLLDHKNKKVHNLMKQIYPPKLKQRYEQLLQMGNIEETTINSVKSNTKMGQTDSMDINVQYFYENVIKAATYQFKDLSAYERTLFQSDLIDYSILQASQTACSLKQNIGVIPKVKSKINKSACNFKIEWVKQKINLKNISAILNLLDKKSLLFLKIQSLFNMFLKDQSFSGKFNNKLPIKTSIDLGSDFTLQVQLKNIMYINIDDAVFSLDYRTKTMSYEQQNMDLASLQETMIMQQNYTINMSRFLGKTERLDDLQQQEANRKFDDILSRQIAGTQLSDDEDSTFQKKQGGSQGDIGNIMQDNDQ